MQKHTDQEINATHGERFVSRYYFWSKVRYYFLFRAGPVPNVSNGRYHKGSYYRRLRHHRSLVERERLLFEGFECPWKGNKRIADPWDEYPRQRTKSWKVHRKTQWKSQTS